MNVIVDTEYCSLAFHREGKYFLETRVHLWIKLGCFTLFDWF